jgi:hypothetical protein
MALSGMRDVLASPAACACQEIGHIIYFGLLLHQATACTGAMAATEVCEHHGTRAARRTFWRPLLRARA